MARLINIRLNDEDEARVAELRERGVEISELVRSAIREEYERRARASRPRGSAVEAIRQLDAEYPTPADAPARPAASTDREAFRRAAAKHFGRANRRQGRRS